MIWGMVRHGEAVRKVPGEVLGPDTDHGLTNEAERSPIKGYLSRVGLVDRPAVVWTSPAPRALRTAFLITQGTMVGVQVKDWLQDRDYGDRIGEDRVYPEGMDDYTRRLFYKPTGGESLLEVKGRIFSNFGQENYNKVLIVSHELVLQLLFGIVTGIDPGEVYRTLTIDEGNCWRPGVLSTPNERRFGTEVST